ncbi:MAG: hypothetical protein R6W73_04995 [Candidatus Saliniplasma sp.]
MGVEENNSESSCKSIISDQGNRDKGKILDKNLFTFNIEGIIKVQIIIIILLAIFMYFIGNPGQWIVGLIIIGLIGVNVVYYMYGKSKKMRVWERENKLDDIVHLRISRTSDVAKRAFKGNELSQAILEEKMISEFIDKMEDKRNLRDSEIDYLLDHPTELKKVIEDDELTNFVLKGKSLQKMLQTVDEGDSKKTRFGKMTEDKNYKRKIERLVKKMEEWN